MQRTPIITLVSAFSGLLAVAILACTLRLDRLDLSVPLNYLQDANIFLLRAKAIVEGNWIWSNPRVGMPFGADWRDFPMNITLDTSIMWLLSRFTSSPPLIVNLDWLIGVGLTGGLSCYAFARLGFNLVASPAFGAIFALLPYTYFRGTRHLHCADYAVPLIALAAIEIVRGSWTDDAGYSQGGEVLRIKVPLYAWLASLLAALAYVYTAFFAAFVLVMSGLLGLLRNRDMRALVVAALLVSAIGGIIIVDLSPSLAFWARNGQNASMLFKSPAEAELYGLKIRYLVTPVPDHPIPLFRAAEARLSTTKYPLFPNENEWGRLGTIGSVGFVYLVIVSLSTFVGRRSQQTWIAGLLGPCGALTFACVLFASVGAFGDFFNAFVSPDIRCYTRIFPFIGFFSVVSAAALLTPLEKRVPASLRLPLWLTLAVAAGYDQAVPSYANDHHQAIYKLDADFVRYVETLLPPNSAVLELPFVDFPYEISPGNIVSNDLLRPYLHSAKYRWSWPSVSGTTAAEWNRMAASLGLSEMLRAAVQRGFSGLWLDSAGYLNGASPEPAITAELIQEPRRSSDGRFLFYDLRVYAGVIGKTAASMTRAELTAQNPVQVLFERGFYYKEHDGERTWRWSLRKGRITIINPLNIKRRTLLSMHIQTADRIQHSIRLLWARGDVSLRDSESQSVSINLGPLESVALDLICDCEPEQPDGSPRSLYFFVSDVKLRDAP